MFSLFSCHLAASYTLEFMAATKKKKSTLVDVAKIGSLGGHARAKNLTESELSDAGRKAVQARWAKAKKKAK